ncbi:KH domain-containing protein [Candidatus Nanosalina sp. VS9-1]|uniref:KH domain-containing protein n=1 Tax=Candidatus Nanosalina sp. VS9-1 TaxID=3388566 RepID=UPI0039E0C16E
MKQVRIPDERVGVLIGEGGETKREFEDLTDCSLTIEDNLVKVDGEVLDEMKAQEVVKAIGRGFSPERAFHLLEKDKMLYLIDIGDFADTSNAEERLKGRVIGRDGETRRHIEKQTETDISVYGGTVAIIGKGRNVEVSREAIRMLLKGSSHSTAYNYLEKNQGKIEQ